MQIKVVPI